MSTHCKLALASLAHIGFTVGSRYQQEVDQRSYGELTSLNPTPRKDNKAYGDKSPEFDYCWCCSYWPDAFSVACVRQLDL